MKNLILVGLSSIITFFATKKFSVKEENSTLLKISQDSLSVNIVDSFQLKQDSLASVLNGGDKKVEKVITNTISTIVTLKETVANLKEEVKVLKNENISLKSIINNFSSDSSSKFELLPISKGDKQ